MHNLDLRWTETSLYRAKLAALLEGLKRQYENGSFATHEEALNAFQQAINLFYQHIETPFLTPKPVRPGTSPDYQVYNILFGEIGSDLSVLFQEIANLEMLIIRNFNYVLSEKDKLTTLIKQIDSRIGDYILYSEDSIGQAFYYKESFSNIAKIDYNTKLLSKKQCEIWPSEGIATLPVVSDGRPTARVMRVKIDDSSNGSVGNLQQIGAAPHDQLEDILDSNPDTWFEYEIVSSSSVLDIPLQLSLTFTLDKPQVINQIHVNPNNFGFQIPVKIRQIDTSFDGKVWVSIKDDITVADFISEDEDDAFVLAPSTSKFAGQGIYTFAPRKVQYLSIALEQNQAYEIQTPAGRRWRFAIGIRDIEAHGIRYEKEGDLISKKFIFDTPAQKISLLVNENPIEISQLADITHQISPDDGSTWYSIQPQQRSGTDIPEILHFNTGFEDSIETPSDLKVLRHRILMTRNTDAFKAGSLAFALETREASDILAVPQMSPMRLGLSRSPASEKVVLMNPRWGSRSVGGLGYVSDPGGDRQQVQPVIHRIGRSSGINGMKFQLPISFVKGTVERENVVIWVDNDSSWSRVGSFAASTSTDKHYTLSANGTLQFGDSENAEKGRVPGGGAVIGFTLTEETLLPTATSPYICTLAFPTDGEKSNIKVYRTDAVRTGQVTTLRPEATVHRLPHRNIVEVAFDNPGTFADEKSYIDGSSEFESGVAGQYSVDYANGIVYNYNETPVSGVVTVTYSYIPIVQLSDTEWNFLGGIDNNYQKITITDNAYASQTATYDLGGVSGNRVVNIGRAIVPKSLVFSSQSPFSSGAMPREISYINGAREFEKQDADINLAGHYSVDYRNGKIYVAPADTMSGEGNVQYKYVQFFICYNIARILSPDKYTVDTKTGSVSISEAEAVRAWGGADADIRGEAILKAQYEYVHKTQESIEELEPYFTPICRELAYKILPVS